MKLQRYANPFSNSILGQLAGYVSRETGQRPCRLLGYHESIIEDLMLDAAVLSKTAPEEPTLADELRQKRKKWKHWDDSYVA